jgi:predicted RNA-binding Zn-ribbon protein involved in translation (DUF1610 family)
MDRVIIGTPNRKKWRKFAWVGAAILGLLSIVPLMVAVEVSRQDKSPMLLSVPIIVGLLGLVLTPITFYLISTIPALTLHDGVLCHRRHSKDKRIESLDEIAEIILWDSAKLGTIQFRADASLRSLLVLKKPFEQLSMSTQVALQKLPMAFSRDVKQVPCNHFLESLEAIAMQIAHAIHAGQGRHVPIRQMTEDGPHDIDIGGLNPTHVLQPAVRPLGPGYRCAECGFDLRAHRVDQVCPECGHAVAKSVQGRQLVFADRQWLANINRGASILTVAAPAMVSLFGVTILQVVRHGKSAPVTSFGIFLPLQLSFICFIVAWVGTFYLTKRESSQTGMAPDPRARIGSRAFMAFTLLVLLMYTLNPASRLLAVGLMAGALCMLACAYSYCMHLHLRGSTRPWVIISGIAAACMAFVAIPLLGAFVTKVLAEVLPKLGISFPIGGWRTPAANTASPRVTVMSAAMPLMLVALVQIVGSAISAAKLHRVVRAILARTVDSYWKIDLEKRHL